MSEENKAIIRRYYDEVNKGNFAIVDELFAPDFVRHPLAAGGQEERGLEAWKLALTTSHAAWPEGGFTIEDMVAEGDKVVVRLTARSTDTVGTANRAPTGKQIAVARVVIFRIAGGKVVEFWALQDALGMQQQLGLIPTPGQG